MKPQKITAAAVATTVIAGFLLHVVGAVRTWIGADEAHLLRLGSKLASDGVIVPFGKLLGGGGTNPGILLQLLFGIPMFLMHDYRAPMVAVIASHCIAFVLCGRIVQKVYGNAVLLPFALVYWLSAWRIYNASLLWEPAFIFLPAALHLWSCYKLRAERDILASGLCVASVVWAMQIHNSFMILLLATIVLIWKKQIRLDWRGGLLGGCVGALTLIPSVVALMHGNLVYDAQQSQGFIGKGLVTVLPTLKGVLYWFTLGGVDVVRNLKETSYAQSDAKPIIYAMQALSILTVFVSIAASWWYFRPLFSWRGSKMKEHQTSADARWMRNYALSVFAALIASAALSPIVLQGWQVVIALHAASIPMIVWAVERWQVSRPRRTVFLGYGIYALFEIAVMVLLLSGQSIFHRSENIPHDLDPVKDSTVISYIPPLR